MAGAGAQSGVDGEQESGYQDQKTKDAQKGFTKVCYYELLGIEKDAAPKEIAKAYKKMSLKWHPDKNPGEDTTVQFQQVNEANQCLSDPQSRAWYDKHRDQILRGKDPEHMNEGDEDYLTKSKLKPYMTSQCHKGFKAEEPDNFFNVYDRLFRQLDREDELEEQVGTKHKDAPPFGEHYACAEDVFAFYDWWQHFTTCKPFAYADLYNASQAPNRRVKRLIEVDNKKERDKERRAFNEAVRLLVAKLKEQDPRYKKFMLIQQQEKEERKRKAEEEKAARKAAEAERLRLYREELALHYQREEEEAIRRGDVEIEYVEEFRCEVCRKSFKKEGGLDNHLKSKKHRDAETKLKASLQLDEATEDKVAEQQRLREQALKEEEDRIRAEDELKRQ